jgi:hypothetical protein
MFTHFDFMRLYLFGSLVMGVALMGLLGHAA